MTDEQRGDGPQQRPTPKPGRRRWWEKQRWLVPIAVVVLGVAVVAVIAFLRSDRADRQEAIAGEGASQGPGAQSEAGTSAGASPSPEAGADEQSGDQPPDPATAQVCQRIIALQEQVQSQGIDPLAVYTEVTEIERQARGTPLASQANDAARTVQRFITGRTDAESVIAAGTQLASAC